MKRTIAVACGVVLLSGGFIAAAPAVASACSVADGIMERTDSSVVSDSVECLQQTLNDQGYDSGPVDGWFGPVTERAVTRYQQATGITVDGWVGSETRSALGIDYGGDSSSSSDTSSSSSDSFSGGSGVYWPWDAIAECESGGNWSINTGNGYYGGLQFALGSWQAVGGSGLPSEASASEQVYRAELLKDQQGFGAWPTCARIVGVL